MRIIDTAARARKSLAHAKARTILTSLAIGVGAFTITLSLAAGVGGKEYAEDIVTSNTDPKSVMVMAKSKQQQGPAEYNPDRSSASQSGAAQWMDLLDDKDIDTIKNTTHVVSVQPNIQPAPVYITRENEKKYELSAVTIFDPAISQKYAAGNSNGKLANDEIIINEEYRKALGFTSAKDAVGQTIQIAVHQAADVANMTPPKEFNYKIAAVTGESGIVASSNGSIFVNFDTAKQLNNYIYEGTTYGNSYMYVTAKVDDKANADSVKESLKKHGYDAQTAQDIMSFIFQFINVLQGILLGFGALAVLTAIFGIINTQYISVLERTQQIGLMKALGMRRRDVGRLFKFEAAWIGFLGGAIGSGLAFLGGWIANPYITNVLKLDDGTNLLQFPLWIFAAVIGGLMVVSVSAGILPARKAAKLDPIEALRTE